MLNSSMPRLTVRGRIAAPDCCRRNQGIFKFVHCKRLRLNLPLIVSNCQVIVIARSEPLCWDHGRRPFRHWSMEFCVAIRPYSMHHDIPPLIARPRLPRKACTGNLFPCKTTNNVALPSLHSSNKLPYVCVPQYQHHNGHHQL